MADLFDEFGIDGPPAAAGDLFDEFGIDNAPASAPKRGMLENSLSMANDRFTDLAGNFVQGVGSVMRFGGQGVERAFDAVGMPLPTNDQLPFNMIAPSEALTQIGDAIGDQDFGYTPNFTIDQALENPSFKNLGGAILENAPAAVADMAGLAANPLGYGLARNQEIAEARATNNGRQGDQPTFTEFQAAAPATASSILLDRFALKGNLGQGPLSSGDVVNGVGDVLKESGKGLVRESVTEGVQEGVLEYAGESVGTEKGWDGGTAVKRAAGGALIGGPVGAGVSGMAATMRMTPKEIEAEAERLGLTPEEVVRLYEEGLGSADIGDVIAGNTGTNIPGPVADPQARNKQRAATERQLGEALAGQTDVIRRDDLEGFDDDGNPLYREGARPAQDPQGRQANPETLGNQREADRIATELGLTLPGDRLDAAARDIAAGVDPREAVRSYAPEQNDADFRVADARRQRRDASLTPGERADGSTSGGFTQGRDYQAAGSEKPQGRGESILLIGAKYDRNGKLTAGEQVFSESDAVTNEDGSVTMNVVTGDGRKMAVPMKDITIESTPANPRMEQDFEDRAVERGAGIGTETPGPRKKTDAISTRMAADQTPQDRDPDAVLRAEPKAEPGAPPPRRGDTFENEEDFSTGDNASLNRPAEARFNEVNRPPQSPGLGDALTGPPGARAPDQAPPPPTPTPTPATGEVTGEVESQAEPELTPRDRQVAKTVKKHQGKTAEVLASEMTVPQLKQVAAQLGMKTSGNKAALASGIAERVSGLESDQKTESSVGNADSNRETSRAPEATPEAQTETKAPEAPKPASAARRREVDVDNDSLLDAIGRSGGMSTLEGRRMGFSDGDLRAANRARPGRQPFRNTTERTSADTAEAMTELGYLQGDRDTRELADRLGDEFRGEKVWSSMGNAAERQALADEFQMEQDRQQAETDEAESSANYADTANDFDPFDRDQNPDSFSDDDGFGLEEQTEADLAQQELDQQEAERAESAARKDDEQRFDADKQRDGFTLTGSARKVDVAEAAGQGNMFDIDSVPAADRVDLGGSVLFSGVPSLDMIKRLFGPMFVGSKAEMDAYATRLKDTVDDFRNRDNQTTLWQKTRRGYNMTLGDLDSATRALADRYQSKTMSAVADAFHRTAGGKTKGFTQQTLSVRRNKAMNKYGSQFKVLADKMAANGIRRNDKATQDKIYQLLENPKMPRRGTLGEVVTEIDAMLKELRTYQQERGIDVGYVEGYVPRWLSRKEVGRDKRKFLRKASEAYRSMGSDTETAAAQAAALFDAVIEGDQNTLGQSKAGSQAGVDNTKPRKLTKEASKILADGGFWERDVERAVSSYLHSAIKRGEVADTEINGIKLGDNAQNWSKIREQMQNEDESISPDDLSALAEDVAYATGLAQTSGNQAMRTTSAVVRSWGALTMLDRVALSTFAELVMGPIRATTGNAAQDLGTQAINLTNHIDNTGRRLLRAITAGGVGKNQALDDAYDLAEYLAVTAGDAISYSMQARMMGQEADSRLLTDVTDKYYRNVGLTQLNDYSRVQSLRMGNRFLAFQARDAQRGPRQKNRANVMLREMGVPAAKTEQFAKWYDKNFGQTGISPTASAVQALEAKSSTDKEMAGIYDRAMHTFVDQAIQRPDSSTRPRWADSPLGGMVFQLLNFTWAFQKNVINRTVRIAGNNELSVVDRALMGTSFVVGAAMLTAMASIGNMLREELDKAMAETGTGREPSPETEWRKVEKAVSYAGLTGRLDPFLQTFAGIRYQRSVIESVVGPTIGQIASGADALLELGQRNSDNTNTAERKGMKTVHQMVLTPFLQAALTQLPLAGPAGRAVVMGSSIAGVRATREPFVAATAGEESRALRNRRMSNPLTGVTEPDKKSGSGSGRSGGRSAGRETERGTGR